MTTTDKSKILESLGSKVLAIMALEATRKAQGGNINEELLEVLGSCKDDLLAAGAAILSEVAFVGTLELYLPKWMSHHVRLPQHRVFRRDCEFDFDIYKPKIPNQYQMETNKQLANLGRLVLNLMALKAGDTSGIAPHDLNPLENYLRREIRRKGALILSGIAHQGGEEFLLMEDVRAGVSVQNEVAPEQVGVEI